MDRELRENLFGCAFLFNFFFFSKTFCIRVRHVTRNQSSARRLPNDKFRSRTHASLATCGDLRADRWKLKKSYLTAHGFGVRRLRYRAYFVTLFSVPLLITENRRLKFVFDEKYAENDPALHGPARTGVFPQKVQWPISDDRIENKSVRFIIITRVTAHVHTVCLLWFAQINRWNSSTCSGTKI